MLADAATTWVAVSAVATGLLAIATFAFVYAAFRQLDELKKTGLDASRAADAATRSAAAAEQTANVAAEEITLARAQVETAQEAIRAATQPVINARGLVHERTNPPRFRALVENVGPGPAAISSATLRGGELERSGASTKPIIGPGGRATLLFWAPGATHEVANAFKTSGSRSALRIRPAPNAIQRRAI